jgi:hypothetical protein
MHHHQDADEADEGKGEPVDFGANQVIIVRTEAARAELYDAMPELRLVKGQVLTIAESKGCVLVERHPPCVMAPNLIALSSACCLFVQAGVE